MEEEEDCDCGCDRGWGGGGHCDGHEEVAGDSTTAEGVHEDGEEGVRVGASLRQRSLSSTDEEGVRRHCDLDIGHYGRRDGVGEEDGESGDEEKEEEGEWEGARTTR